MSGKKGRKTRPEDPPDTRFGPQNGRKSTSETPKSPNFPEKKVDFWTVRFSTVFSTTEKNVKKMKKEAYKPAAFRNDGPGRARRRGKERQALRVRHGFLDWVQHASTPVGVRRIQCAAHVPPRSGKVRTVTHKKARILMYSPTRKAPRWGGGASKSKPRLFSACFLPLFEHARAPICC